MLAHFNKMNTLLLFYRKMGNTLFLEQDEYIFIVFRNEERYFIFLTARWALSYHFIYTFIFLYIIFIPDAFKDVRGIWWICSLHSESNFRWFGIFPSSSKKHKGKKGTFPRSTKKQRKQVQKKTKGTNPSHFPSSAKNIRGKKALSLAAQKTKETSPKKAKWPIHHNFLSCTKI